MTDVTLPNKNGWPRQLHSPSNPEKFVSPYVLKNKIRKGVVNNFNPAFKRPAEIDVSTQQKKIKDEEKVEKTEPVVQKELDPTMSRILEDELQQIMTKVWEELPASPACEAEKMVVDKLRSEAGDDLKRLLGLNVTKRLLNVHNPIYVKVEFDIKPEGENLMQFLRWLNVTSMKRERGAGAGPGGAAGAGGAHHYLVQLRKISDYDRALRVKKIKFGTLKASITSGYNFKECPPKLKSIYSQRKTKEEYSHDNESETLSKKPNIIDETKKNQRNVEPHNKVDAKGDNTKKDEAVDKAKENNTDLKKTPTKPTVNKNPATQNKPQVTGTKKPEPAKNVAKVVTKPASVVKKNNDSVATSTHETNAKKETNVSNATVTKTGTAVAKNTAVKATAPQKATAEVSKVPAEKVKVQTAAKATKPVNQGLTPTTNKPAPKSKPAPKVTPKKTETKKKQVSDFDELDDEDILALMSNAIVLDECRGSDDEN